MKSCTLTESLTDASSHTSTNDDKRHIAYNFGKAARHYDQEAHLQQAIGTALLHDLFTLVPDLQPDRCVDIGCGTGYLIGQLAVHGKQPRLMTGLDISLSMLITAREQFNHAHYLCADAENLPLADNSQHLILSNLALQWLPSLSPFLYEAYRVLAPGGYLAFTTLGPETLRELAEQRALAGLPSAVNRTLSPSDLELSLEQSNFVVKMSKRRAFLHHYPDILALMRALKLLGAHYQTQRNNHRERNSQTVQTSKGLYGRHHLLRLYQQSQRAYRNGIPARYDTYLVILQKPSLSGLPLSCPSTNIS